MVADCEEPSPVIFIKDIAATIFGATCADVFLRIIPVIVAQFLACFDVAEGDNPNRAGGLFYETIRIAGMVDVARRIAQHLAVNFIPLIQASITASATS